MTRYEMLCESLEAAEESLGELVSQHRAEVAHYGDSWPGALQQIKDATDMVAALKAECEKEWIRIGRPTFCTTEDIDW